MILGNAQLAPDSHRDNNLLHRHPVSTTRKQFRTIKRPTLNFKPLNPLNVFPSRTMYIND